MAAGEGEPNEGYIELAALEAAGGVHRDGLEAACGESGSDRVRLSVCPQRESIDWLAGDADCASSPATNARRLWR